MNYLAILATIQLLTQRVNVLEAELKAQNEVPYLTTPQNPSQVNIEPLGWGVDTVPATTTIVPESELSPSTTPPAFSDIQLPKVMPHTQDTLCHTQGYYGGTWVNLPC